jgi:hypothetical protein
MSDLRNGRTLLASLRDALQAIEHHLAPTRTEVDEITAHATCVRDGVERLCALRGHEAAYTGVDMLYDRAQRPSADDGRHADPRGRRA